MARYIDAEELLKRLNACKYPAEKTTMRQVTYNAAISAACRTVDAIPAADVVSRGVLEQVMWERDLAISQLAEIGKGLGAKMDDVAEVRYGHWIDHSAIYDGGYYECSLCGEPWVFIEGGPKENNANYCPNCGGRMDAEMQGNSCMGLGEWWAKKVDREDECGVKE